MLDAIYDAQLKALGLEKEKATGRRWAGATAPINSAAAAPATASFEVNPLHLRGGSGGGGVDDDDDDEEDEVPVALPGSYSRAPSKFV